MTNNNGWLSVKEAANLAGYTEEHVRRLARSGEIKSKKVVIVVLIGQASLEAYLENVKKLGERRGRKKEEL